MESYKLNKDKTFTKVDKIEEATMSEPERRVGYDELSDGTVVSTVFLGFNHNYRGGDPILFETMVFNNEELGEYQRRYTTWDIAEKAHKAIVELLKSKL